MPKARTPLSSREATPATPKDLDNVEILSETSPTPEASGGDVGFTDDANWEDEPEYNLANPHEKSPSPLGSSAKSVRKRKVTGRKMFVAQPSSTRKSKGNISRDTPPLVNINKTRLRDAMGHGVSHSASYVSDVVKTTLWLLRKPLSAFLFVYILAYLLAVSSAAFRAVFAPICWIPGISHTPLCWTPPKIPRWADYPKLAELQGSTFEQLLDETVSGSALSLEVKKAEMATSDLVALVRVSDFTSKDTLAEHLEGFVDAAKKTNRGLQKFSSRVSGAVDSVVAVNDYAFKTIEAHTKRKSTFSILNPFNNALTAQQVVAHTFTESMSVLSTQMRRLILEAEVNLKHLNDLEEMLVTLHGMVSREKADISGQKEELLAELWTILGGNKKRLRGMDGHLFLLRQIGEYRMRAIAHVAAALQTLTKMSEDMEDLRERVTAPELLGDKIPVEVHMKAIRASLDRLQTDRTKARGREEEAYKKIAGIEDDD